MKGTVILLTVALLCCTVQGKSLTQKDDRCPAENPPDHDVLLPAEDCQHFYKCNWGTPVLMPCPPNQEWSQELQRCDWPEVAKCSGDVPPQPPVISTEPPIQTTKAPLPNGCPPTNPPDHDVLLPAEDCEHFYKCNNGKPVLIPCPPGLEWSQELQRCEWPEIAKCSSGGNKPTQPPVIPTEPPIQTTKPPLPDGCPPTNPTDHDVLLPAEDCQHFYKCNNGVPVLQSCPDGLEWSQELQRCEWPEVAKCSGSGSNPIQPTNPPVQPTNPPVEPTKPNLPNGCPPTNPPDHDVLLPAEDCQHFYKCNNGKPVLIPCPPGLEWSQELQRCEWPEIAQCSSGGNNPTNPPVQPTNPPVNPTNPPVQPTEPNLPSGCPPTNPPDHDVLLPAEDCQHFYKCNNGVPVLQSCPPGLEWSQELQRCEWPEVAQCSNGGNKPTNPPVQPTDPPVQPTNPPVQPTEPNLPSGCPPTNPPDHDVLLPAEDCQHYYKCNNGVPVLQSCPPGLEWSQELQRCEWPEVAQCSNGGNKPTNPPVQPTDPPVQPTNPPVQPTEPNLPSGCPPTNPPDHDVLLPAEDCQHFYKCNNGKPVLIPCPPGLEWSQELQRCEWPEVAQCSNGGNKPTNPPVQPTDPPVQPTNPPVQPTEPNLPNGCPPTNPPDHDVLLPAEDCQHFYKCNNGKPVLIPCPPGLEWSQELQRCEWPEVAQCSNGGNKPTNPPVQPTDPPVQPTNPPVQPTEPNLPNGCPPTNPPDHDVLLPAEDCQHFYKCNHGKPVLIPCPPGLEWSQELQRCEWPEVAQCSNGGNKPTNPPVQPTDPPVQPTNPPLQPTYPPVQPTDPPVQPTDPPVQPTEPNLPNGCPPTNPPDHDVLLPAEDCQHFYKCNHGKPVLIPCPPGLEWSQELQRCEWPEIAQCSNSGNKQTNPPVQPTDPPMQPTTQPSVQPTQEPMTCPPTWPPNEDVLFSAEDCGHYYQCDHGKPVLRSCPQGLEWCQARKRCEWPEIAQCSQKGKVIPTPTFSTLPDGCPTENPEDGDIFLPAADCQHFYICNNGVPVLQSCPDGLEWSQDLQQCEWPELAQCSSDKNSPKPSPTLQTSVAPTKNPVKPTADPTPECKEGDDVLPAEDCQHYYICENGVPKRQSCPGGLEWSQDLKRCDWPKIAKCSKEDGKLFDMFYSVLLSAMYDDENKPNPQCPAENGDIEVILGIPGVCDKFYKCDWGIAKVENCPPGTEFNHRMVRCDFPSEAQCVPGETGM